MRSKSFGTFQKRAPGPPWLRDYPGGKRAATKRGNNLFVVSCGGKSFDFSLFRLNLSPKTSLNIPSLRNLLSLIVKTTCVVFLETFVNFSQVYIKGGFHFERNHHGGLYDH